MLDEAQELCLKFKRIKQLLQQKPQKQVVSQQKYQSIIKEVHDFWTHIHPMETENIVFQVVKRLGVEVEE